MPNVEHYFASDGDLQVMIKIARTELDMMKGRVMDKVLDKIVDGIVTSFLESHSTEIISKLDQQAIANLAIAEAAKEIRKKVL